MKIVKDMASFSDSFKKLFYMMNAEPCLDRNALYSDMTEEYMIPCQPGKNEDLTIRFRTARYNVDEVWLVTSSGRFRMKKAYTDELFDFYEVCINAGEEKFNYFFEIKVGKTVCYYNMIGQYKELNPFYNFRVTPGFKVPEWTKGAVMYQIFVDRFCNGDVSNDVLDGEYYYIDRPTEQVKDWNSLPQNMDVARFYGGDLQGVLDKLDYLKELGVDVIYFNPLFVSPSNHKYDAQDYGHIDPHYGKIVSDRGECLNPGDKDNSHASRYIDRVTNPENLKASDEFFAHVVDEIHKRGMKVIIDGVFNHCGSFNRWMDREKIYKNSDSDYKDGAYVSQDSPYRNFFKFFSQNWPDNGDYDGWWGNYTLPKLNYEESKELEDYIIGIGRKWVSAPYNCDGWRLDVAADLGHSAEYNHSFWKRFRKEVREANPDAVIFAEHYGDANDWLENNEWDTIMNYDAFMEPVTWFLTGMQKHSDEFRQDMLGNPYHFFNGMKHNMSRMGTQAVYISMNELSNHDHSRFLTRTNKRVGRLASCGSKAAEEGINKGILREAVVIQMTWPGAPTIYYGDEAGVCGWTDPDNRRTYPWGHEDEELIKFHKDIISIHKDNPALMKGCIKDLAMDYNLISYGRFYKDNIIIVVINNSEDERRASIPVWQAGVNEEDTLEQLMVTDVNGYSTTNLWYSVSNGVLDIGLRGTSAVILRKIK